MLSFEVERSRCLSEKTIKINDKEWSQNKTFDSYLNDFILQMASSALAALGVLYNMSF